MRWYNNDTTIRVIDGKEYISSDSSHVIRFFKISRPNARADSNNVNWKSHDIGYHHPTWLLWFWVYIIPAIIFLHHFIRYGNTRRAGRRILSDLIRNVRKFNNNEIVEQMVKDLKTLDQTFEFTPKSILYRNKDDLVKVKAAYQDLKDKELLLYLETFIKDEKDNERDPAQLIKKLEDGELIEEFRSLSRSNIQVLEEAMSGAYYNIKISQKIQKLREDDKISKNEIDKILNRFTYGTTDVASWGKKTLDLLEGLRRPEIHITAPQGYKLIGEEDIQEGEQKLETDIDIVEEDEEKEDIKGKLMNVESRIDSSQSVSDLHEVENTMTEEDKQKEKNKVIQFFSDALDRLASFFAKKGDGLSDPLINY
jgi:uncharacterized protein YlzI (FlbEa/FlbD family)